MNIVIIEDDKTLAYNISKKIRRHGYKTLIFNSVLDFKNSKTLLVDLYLIDVNLPDGTGLDIIRYLRLEKKSIKPILIMSCLGTSSDKILGLDLGADDYISKSFSPDELISRIKALLRRPSYINNTLLKYNNIDFNLVTKSVFLNGSTLHIPNKEKLILELFMLHKGEVITKSRLIDVVWCDESILVSDNTINATLSKLRRKLGNSFSLKTNINEGYILE